MNLNQDELSKIKTAMSNIGEIAGRCVGAPFDPRIEALLEVVHSLLNEQVTLDKKYVWEEKAKQDDRFLDTQDVPSVDDLRRMIEGDDND